MSDLDPPRIERLTDDGFYAYIQPDGGWGLNNVGIHVGERGVLLVDTVFTVNRAHALAGAVAGLTDRPVHTIVNTHHHGDHTYGNFAFPGSTIISHGDCRAAVLETGLKTTQWFPGVDFGDIDVHAPFVTFDDALTIHCDGTPAILRALGPAHTDRDVVVWVPDKRLLFAGDLLFNGGTPFVLMGSISGLVETLTAIGQWGARTVVPGHGDVCGAEVIDDQLAYLDFLLAEAREAFEKGKAPLDAARDIDLGAFGGWTDSERLVGNLHRAYSEFRGEPRAVPLDYQRIVDEMVEYNGGRPLRCLA